MKKPDLSNAQEYLNRGVEHHNLGEWDAALENYSKSIELKPQVLAYNNRALLHQAMSQYEKALGDYHKAV